MSLLLFAFLLVFVSCAPSPAGTGSQPPATTSVAQPATGVPAAEQPKWPQRPEKKVSLTVGVADSPSIEDWKTNAMTLHLEEQLNVDLSFVLLPSASNELVQKVELMALAGGKDLPDIILHNLGGLSNLEKYGQMGMLRPLNEYYNTMSHYLDTEGLPSCKMAPMAKEEFLRYITCTDGNIYAMGYYIPNANNMYAAARIMIYYTWLEESGIL